MFPSSPWLRAPSLYPSRLRVCSVLCLCPPHDSEYPFELNFDNLRQCCCLIAWIVFGGEKQYRVVLAHHTRELQREITWPVEGMYMRAMRFLDVSRTPTKQIHETPRAPSKTTRNLQRPLGSLKESRRNSDESRVPKRKPGDFHGSEVSMHIWHLAG